ncbi:MAG: hypothetical protein HY619_08190 [Thaumarchaeota archaeon]|nr:hypothetical protein [Nitrososphaerota archaeon]
MPVRLSSAEVSFLIHATEDEDRLIEAVAEKLSVPKNLFVIKRMKGHFDNPISQCMAVMHGDLASRFAETVFSRIRVSDRIILKNALSDHIDEHGSVYLRIDKQKLVNGKIELAQRDPIRVRLKLASPWRRSSSQIMQELLLEKNSKL